MRRRRHKRRNNREGYEFSLEVKKEAKKRSGLKGYTETHHKVPIFAARNYGVERYLIKSIHNAQVMKHDKHLRLHQEKWRYDDFDDELKELREQYIGGLIFLLKLPDKLPPERTIYDSTLGEVRTELLQIE